MLTNRLGLIAVCAAATAVAIIPMTAVQAAHDTEPPVLSTPIKARFLVGTQLDQFRDAEEGHAYYDVPVRLSWSATDNVDPSLNFDIWAHPQGAEPERIGNFITDTVFDTNASDYDGFFGGGALVVDNWSVQAYDDADNSVERSVYGAHLLVTQDDGAQTFGSESTDVSVRYVGTWTTATCMCFADRTTRRTNEKGAAVIMRVRVPANEDVRRVAVVMDQAPQRGRVQLKVDGENRATLDTSSPTAVHRSIVWTTSLAPGVHTIRIANLATPSRPRVDFDAIVVN